nr:IPExxxVDY family protein [Mucilaginibacter sp. SP1R1]
MILNRKFLKFEIDFDFVLIAVTTSLKDYRVCYLINKFLNFNFIKSNDLSVDIYQGSEPVLFSLYHYQWETTETDFYFIGNKGSEGYLVPEIKSADYFLMIRNYIDDDDLDNLISTINKIPEIVAAVKIDPKKIKSRENLLF